MVTFKLYYKLCIVKIIVIGNCLSMLRVVCHSVEGSRPGGKTFHLVHQSFITEMGCVSWRLNGDGRDLPNKPADKLKLPLNEAGDQVNLVFLLRMRRKTTPNHRLEFCQIKLCHNCQHFPLLMRKGVGFHQISLWYPLR